MKPELSPWYEEPCQPSLKQFVSPLLDCKRECRTKNLMPVIGNTPQHVCDTPLVQNRCIHKLGDVLAYSLAALN